MPAPASSIPRKEIRIGLVLYGGVSLAIYIYGVVFEFLRAVRASKGLENNVYSTILDQTNSDVNVDIISGTSAGGINGVFLAKALSNGLSMDSFEKLRALWLKSADFFSLLRPGRAEPAALLDEIFFEEQFREGLKQMDEEAVDAEKSTTTLVPATSALDLFITSTDLNGRILSGKDLEEDYFGRPIETKEYRKVFHLKFRTKGYNPSDRELGYDRNDLSPSENERLLKICRATSAFPAALRPVKIRKGDKVTESLLEPGEGDVAFLTDGGVLNNKPFTDTIGAISRRGAFGKVDRILFYVEPDPENFRRPGTKETVEPSFWDVIGMTTVGIRAYQSLTRDMLDIKDRNERIRWFSEILKGAEKLIENAKDSHGEPLSKLSEQEYRTYLESQPLFEGYQALKVAQLRDRLLNQCLARALGIDNSDAAAVSKMKPAFNSAVDEIIKENGLKDFLGAFDTPYRVRRFFRLVEVTESVYRYPNLTEADHKAVCQFLASLWALLDRANQIEWRVWDSRDAKPEGWFRSRLLKLKREFETLDDDSLKKAITALLQSMFQPAEGGFRGLCEEFADLAKKGEILTKAIDEFLTTFSTRQGQTLDTFGSLSQIYAQFEFRDMFIYPMEVLGNLGERDTTEVIPITPKNATVITSDPKVKLAGDTFFHFGGFLDMKWRANDIMWGRLDAAEIIVRTLCKKSSCSNQVRDQLIDEVLQNILKNELPDALASAKGYKRYLREDYRVGEESLGDLDAGKRATLGVDMLLSFRDMLKYDEQQQRQRKSNKAFQFVDSLLLKLLNWIGLPLTVLVQALFAKDSLTRAIFRLFIFAVGAWGFVTLALFLLGKLMSISWLNISLPVAGLAVVAMLVPILYGILLLKLKGGQKLKT